MAWLWKPAIYAGNISAYLSKCYISLNNKNFIIPDIKMDMHGIIGKNKYAVLDPEYFADMPWPKKEKLCNFIVREHRKVIPSKKNPHIHRSGLPRYPIFFWKANTAVQRQSRRFLKGIDNNFLKQVITEPTRELALLHLMLINKRACSACEAWEQLWLQWPQDEGVQDPEGRKQHK